MSGTLTAVDDYVDALLEGIAMPVEADVPLTAAPASASEFESDRHVAVADEALAETQFAEACLAEARPTEARDPEARVADTGLAEAQDTEAGAADACLAEAQGTEACVADTCHAETDRAEPHLAATVPAPETGALPAMPEHVAVATNAPPQIPRPTPAAPASPRAPAFVPPAFTGAPAPETAPVQSRPLIASSQRWLRVAVGTDSYAIELLCVQEVVRLAPIVAMRGASRAVLGVMNLRGRIVPVFDLGLWLDAGCARTEGDDDGRTRIVVVERDDELIGVLVSQVEDVVTLGRERIEPPLLGTPQGAILGIARVGPAPTVLLDANALFGA